MAQKILVIGASGLIGSAVADALEDRGHQVVRASRSSGERVDIRDADALAQLFQRVGPLDAVVTATGSVPFRPVDELTLDDYRAGFDDKTLGQISVATIAAPHLRDGGSITLTTGILSDRPVPTGAAASLANGALNAYVRAAAPYLPRDLRVNAVSPNVLVEAPGYHASFPGFTPVAAADVARAYADVIEGDGTGEVVSV
ncbi:MAG TPA: short chain dehydrogenase [Microbacterium sp.]|nr:short chain dehydrogenase [Microbacterium sp.]